MHSKNKGKKRNGNKPASWFVRLTQRAPNKRSCAQYSGDRLIRLIRAPQLLSIYTSGVPETRADTGKRRQCLRYEVSCFSFRYPHIWRAAVERSVGKRREGFYDRG